MRYRLAMDSRRMHQLGVDRASSLLHRAIGRRMQRVDELQYRLRERARTAIEGRARRRQMLDGRLRYFDPRPRLGRDRRRLDAAGTLALQAMRVQLARRRSRFEAATAKLSQLSPLTILNRGYAIVTNEAGRVLTNPEQAPAESQIGVRLAEGSLTAKVS